MIYNLDINNETQKIPYPIKPFLPTRTCVIKISYFQFALKGMLTQVACQPFCTFNKKEELQKRI